jgi:hypothetical protein
MIRMATPTIHLPVVTVRNDDIGSFTAVLSHNQGQLEEMSAADLAALTITGTATIDFPENDTYYPEEYELRVWEDDYATDHTMTITVAGMMADVNFRVTEFTNEDGIYDLPQTGGSVTINIGVQKYND